MILEKGVYTVSGYVKNDSNSNKVYLNIEGLNVSKIDSRAEVNNDDYWHDVEMGFRVDADNSQVQIHLVNHSSGIAYFDNIQIVNGYKDIRKNIVNDASFSGC